MESAAQCTRLLLAHAAVRLRPTLDAPTVRDLFAFEEHVEGAMKTVSASAVVAAEWYEAPVFYFTNPYALAGAHDDACLCHPAARCWTSSSRSLP